MEEKIKIEGLVVPNKCPDPARLGQYCDIAGFGNHVRLFVFFFLKVHKSFQVKCTFSCCKNEIMMVSVPIVSECFQGQDNKELKQMSKSL